MVTLSVQIAQQSLMNLKGLNLIKKDAQGQPSQLFLVTCKYCGTKNEANPEVMRFGGSTNPELPRALYREPGDPNRIIKRDRWPSISPGFGEDGG